jgi:nitronate monooxygenase
MDSSSETLTSLVDLAEPRNASGVRSEELRAPVIVAPMYLVSGPELVIASCRAGLIGSFPTLNAHTTAHLASWFEQIGAALADLPGAEWAVGMIVNRCYGRLERELELIAEHRPDVVITTLGSPLPVVETVRGYGGTVFADVVTVEHALKAADGGADGLVLTRDGAGRAGQLSPAEFVSEVRRFFGGPLVLGGAISTGREVRAARLLGADLAYVGAPFSGCPEVLASPDYLDLLMGDRGQGIAAVAELAGVPANWLSESVGGTQVRRTAAEVADRLVAEYRATAP